MARNGKKREGEQRTTYGHEIWANWVTIVLCTHTYRPIHTPTHKHTQTHKHTDTQAHAHTRLSTMSHAVYLHTADCGHCSCRANIMRFSSVRTGSMERETKKRTCRGEEGGEEGGEKKYTGAERFEWVFRPTTRVPACGSLLFFFRPVLFIFSFAFRYFFFVFSTRHPSPARPRLATSAETTAERTPNNARV